MDLDGIRKTYGLGRRNWIRCCVDYMAGQSFGDLPAEGSSRYSSYPVQVEVLGIEPKCSKAGTVYYSLKVRDEVNSVRWVTVWNEDLEAHHRTLAVGSVIRMQVCLPTPPFTSFTLANRPRRSTKPDERIVKMVLPLPPLRKDAQ